MKLNVCFTNQRPHEIVLRFLRVPVSLLPAGQKGDSITVPIQEFLWHEDSEDDYRHWNTFAGMVDSKFITCELDTDLPVLGRDPEVIVSEDIVTKMPDSSPVPSSVPVLPIKERIKQLLEASSLRQSESGSLLNRVANGGPVFGPVSAPHPEVRGIRGKPDVQEPPPEIAPVERPQPVVQPVPAREAAESPAVAVPEAATPAEVSEEDPVEPVPAALEKPKRPRGRPRKNVQ